MNSHPELAPHCAMPASSWSSEHYSGGAANLATEHQCVRQAWTLSGDSYTPHPGDRPWIAEMYGYSYGAAKAGIAHEWVENALLYPGDPTDCAPRLLPPSFHSRTAAQLEQAWRQVIWFGPACWDASLQGNMLHSSLISEPARSSVD